MDRPKEEGQARVRSFTHKTGVQNKTYQTMMLTIISAYRDIDGSCFSFSASGKCPYGQKRVL